MSKTVGRSTKRHYPTDRELDYLANKVFCSELNTRLGDRTPENILKDLCAPWRKASPLCFRDSAGNTQAIPKDLIPMLISRMDIREVLDLAQESLIVFRIVHDDAFWKRRFMRDFREVIYLRNALGSSYEPPAHETRAFEHGPWRRFYYVTRYWLRAAFKKTFAVRSVFQEFSNFQFEFQHAWKGRKILRTIWSNDGKRLGRTWYISLTTFLHSHFSPPDRLATRENYLHVILQSWKESITLGWRNRMAALYEDVASRLQLLFRGGIDSSWMVSMVKRGYVKQSKEGVPMF
jgi:hypothetical protein